MTVALQAHASIKGTLTTARDGGNAVFDINEFVSNDILNGTGAAQANAAYVDDFTIAASGTLNVDLSSSLVDPNGNVILFTAVKAIFIKADPTNVNDIIIGNGTNPFLGPFGAAAHTLAIRPGGVLMITDGFSAGGWTVTAAIADILKLLNSAGGSAVNGTIVVIGEA